MLALRRRAAHVARQTSHQRRRLAESAKPPGEPSGHAASAGHHEPTHHAPHPHPVNESFGPTFYILLAALPVSIALYKYSHPTFSDPTTTQPPLTRLINSYSVYKERWAARNTLHTLMIEQAAHDRNLFQGSAPSRMIDLKFPEIFNTGSPYNVPAGQYTNLDAVIAHYEKKNADSEAAAAKQREKDAGGRNPKEEIVRIATY